MRSSLKAVLAAVLILGSSLSGPAMAEPPARADVALSDPAAEARARDLFGEIRCVVCQHESIADSPAGIAADLRALVREQIAAGKTDEEIRADLVNRYGDYVLFTPPFRPATLILWLGPALLVLGGGAVIFARSRKRREQIAPLSAEEEEALARLMDEAQNHAVKSPSEPDNKDN